MMYERIFENEHLKIKKRKGCKEREESRVNEDIHLFIKFSIVCDRLPWSMHAVG